MVRTAVQASVEAHHLVRVWRALSFFDKHDYCSSLTKLQDGFLTKFAHWASMNSAKASGVASGYDKLVCMVI